METQRKKQTQTRRQKNVFGMTSGAFMIASRNNTFIDSKQHFLEPKYQVTILKALILITYYEKLAQIKKHNKNPREFQRKEKNPTRKSD